MVFAVYGFWTRRIVDNPMVKATRLLTKRMPAVSVRWRTIVTFVGLALTLVVYNEFLVYYVVLLRCWWPQLDPKLADTAISDTGTPPVKAIILADTHLLGSRLGHWFDKLRREWQMERSFQSAMLVHNPDVVFILGESLLYLNFALT